MWPSRKTSFTYHTAEIEQNLAIIHQDCWHICLTPKEMTLPCSSPFTVHAFLPVQFIIQ